MIYSGSHHVLHILHTTLYVSVTRVVNEHSRGDSHLFCFMNMGVVLFPSRVNKGWYILSFVDEVSRGQTMVMHFFLHVYLKL